jgi:hypothetical protein
MGQGIDHLKDISQSKQLGNSDSAAMSQRGIQSAHEGAWSKPGIGAT